MAAQGSNGQFDSTKDAMAPDPISQGEQVLNQSPAFTDVNLFTSDTPLREAVAREGAAAKIVALLGDLAADARGLFGKVEQAHDLVARKAFDAKQMAMREREFGRFSRNAH